MRTREEIIDTLGKNEPAKKVFWTVFEAIAGQVLIRVLDHGNANRLWG
ncbi:MAG: hypothetical protein WCF90_01315 [Methanomicrobiales archaeon]